MRERETERDAASNDRANSSATRLHLCPQLAPCPFLVPRISTTRVTRFAFCANTSKPRNGTADITDCRHRRDSRIGGCASLLHSPFDSFGTFPQQPPNRMPRFLSRSLTAALYALCQGGRRESGIETRVLGSCGSRRGYTCIHMHVCVRLCVFVCKRARRWVGLVILLVFCDDDVFRVFRGMPRAALIVTELGPRATLVRMRAVALAFSPRVSHPSIPLRLPSPSSCPIPAQRGATTPCRAQRGRRARLSLGQVDGYPAAITPRLHTHDRARTHAHIHACTHLEYICELHLRALRAERIIVMIRFSVVLVTRKREMF